MPGTGLIAVGLVVLAGVEAAPGAEPPSGAAPIRLEDPRFDDHGPGSYIYPTGLWYRRGMYDLRSFVVEVGPTEVTFRVFLDFPIERPDRVMVNSNQALRLDNEIYFRSVDIYVDYAPGSGETEGIPGRNVRFRPSEAWDFALVMTPQPDLVRQILRSWKPMRKVYVADNVRSRGQEVWVTVPLSQVGGAPDARSGYQVVVTGALMQPNFEVFQRVTDAFQLDALTIPVFGVAEEEAFGGGDLSLWQPRAIDILVPPGVTQGEVLGHYDHDTRDFAVLPLVYPEGRGPTATTATTTELPKLRPFVMPRADPPAEPATEPDAADGSEDGFVYTRIREVYEEMAILEARAGVDQPYRVGTVLGARGEELGRVVVTAVYPNFVQATIVEGRERIERGARVRFDPKKE